MNYVIIAIKFLPASDITPYFGTIAGALSAWLIWTNTRAFFVVKYLISIAFLLI
jgi:hypothetical protein